MSNEKKDGLEDVEVVDFTEDNPKPKTEAKLEGVTSFPWKDVSHVMIGPSGVSLVPAGSEQKFASHKNTNYTYPAPGSGPTMLEYDLEQLVGSLNAVTNFENEVAQLKEKNTKLSEELTNTRAELEKVKAELEESKKVENEPQAKTEAEPAPETAVEPKPESEEPAEKTKEEEAKAEKEEASTKENEQSQTKEEDHSTNLAKAMHLMRVAKEKKIL